MTNEMKEQVFVENQLHSEIFFKDRIAELEDKIAEQANKFSDISTIGTVITSIIELEKILPVVMESLLSIINAEVGRMVIFSDTGKVTSSISWGISEEITDSIINNEGMNIGSYIFKTREMLEIYDMASDRHWRVESEYAHIKSLMALPLFARNQIVGAIIVANKINGPHFDGDDFFSLEMIARFAAVAIENSNLHARAVAQQKMETDLEIARQLQKALMPDNVMDFDRMKINAFNSMAMQVGGDFYDVVKLTSDKFILIVADVSNKGFPASLLMSSARSLFRAYVNETDSLSEVMANVNEQLCNDSAMLKGMFVTAIMVYLDFKTGILKAVNAGHPPGWVSLPDGTIQNLKSGGPFIGQFPGMKYVEQTIPLIPGSRIFIYTDGAFECVDNSGKMLGLRGLRDFFEKNHRLPTETFIDKLTAMLDNYSADPDWIDDTTYLLAEIKRL